MTKQERQLIILVAVVIAGGLVFRFWPRAAQVTEPRGDINYRLHEAERLLRGRQNIIARYKAVTVELQKLQTRFFSAADPVNAQISTLKAVEAIAIQASLGVNQKNLVSTHDGRIGVALEGKTSPGSLIRFLYLTSQNRIGLRVNRLQIHGLPEIGQLNYQVTIITLLIKKGDPNGRFDGVD
jgi:hypothetical protein